MKFYLVEIRKAKKGEDCLFSGGVREARIKDDLVGERSSVILREFDHDPFEREPEVHTHAEIAELRQRVEALESAAKAEPKVELYEPGKPVMYRKPDGPWLFGLYRGPMEKGRHELATRYIGTAVVPDADIRPVKVVEAAD